MRAGERKKVKILFFYLLQFGVYIGYRGKEAVQCQAFQGCAESLNDSYFSRNKPMICNGQAKA